jgi:Domain of unknown function (DUF1330)
MNTRCTIALAMLAGAALGAAAIQGLHAQAKPPAYIVIEVDVTDADLYKQYQSKARPLQSQYSARFIAQGGKIDAYAGEPPCASEEFPNLGWRLPTIAAHVQPRRSPPFIAAKLAAIGHLGPVTC